MSRLIPTLLVLLSVGLSACGTIQRPDGPIRIADGALLPAQDPRIRSSDAERVTALTEEVGGRFARDQHVSILALSGGGANGAYGAGVLVGWTDRGERPQFDIVTGVSTGALAAPFAFVGPDWDDELEQAYTNGGASNLLSWRSFAIFLSPSLFSNSVLRKLVDDNVTPELLQAVAREHARGRRLLVATTDLDNQESVIWDMGLLASQGDENSIELFKEVLVASASIPGVFPPVLIAGLQDDNSVTMEMHVDGGVNTPFLAIPEPLLLWTDPDGSSAGSTLYVIVNGQVGRDEGITRGRITDIMIRTYDSMTKASLRAHLAATTAFARRNHMALSLSAIPDNVEASSVRFDQKTMSALFELGRERTRNGEAWNRMDQATENPWTQRIVPLEQVPEALRPQTTDSQTPEGARPTTPQPAPVP